MANETMSTQALAARIRTGLAQWTSTISTVENRARTGFRGAVLRAAVRVRQSLDLPSRTELAELLNRVEAIDAKLDRVEVIDAKLDRAEEARVSETAKIERKQPKAAKESKASRRTIKKVEGKAKKSTKSDEKATKSKAKTKRKK